MRRLIMSRHLDLRCLHKTIIIVCGSEIVNTHLIQGVHYNK